MPELHVLDFDGVDEAMYAQVNAALGLDPATGAGAWPSGLISHVTGATDSGHGYVVEIWESQQAQEEFMASRLGPAMATRGVTAVPHMAWSRVIGHHTPGP